MKIMQISLPAFVPVPVAFSGSGYGSCDRASSAEYNSCQPTPLEGETAARALAKVALVEE